MDSNPVIDCCSVVNVIIIWMNDINTKMFGFLCFAASDVKGGSLEVSGSHQFQVIVFKIIVFIRIVFNVIVFVSELRSTSCHIHLEAAFVEVRSSRFASCNVFLSLILF